MKTFFAILIGAMLLAPIPAQAGHDGCYPIAMAKTNVAKWDKNAVWEQVKEGSKYDALVATYKKAGRPLPVKVDGILIAYVTGPDGKAYVMWGAVSGDNCLAGNSGFQVPKAQFEQIINAKSPKA